MLQRGRWVQDEVTGTCRTCWRSSDSSAGASSALTLSLTFLYLRKARNQRTMLSSHVIDALQDACCRADAD